MAMRMPKEPGVYRVPQQMEEQTHPPLTELTEEEKQNLPWPLTIQEWMAWEQTPRRRTR
jgi:hypothetical protein